MNGIKALLFDVDGTLLDTREFIIQATEYSLLKNGFPVPDRSVIARLVGKPFDEFYRTLSGSTDVIPLQNTHRAFQLENLHLSVPYPHTLETLTALRDRGFKMATITTRGKKTAIESLRLANLNSFFEVNIYGEDAESKPHPAGLLKALEHINELPNAAVMIGDSDLDIEAGKNAGTKTIRATYGFHTERLHETKPDFFISDIRDLMKIL